MPVPNTFSPGTIAASSEVNDNFSHLQAIVGGDSTDTRANLPGDVTLGPRDAVQLTAAGDSGPGAAAGYCQIGWNAELYDSGGGVFKVRRVVAGEGGTALRVGNKGVQVWATGKTDGDLQERMQLGFSARAGEDTSWVYINESWKIQNRDAEYTLGNVGSFRNTLVFLDPPVPLYGTINGGDGGLKGRVVKNIRDIPPGNIPDAATALLISVSAYGPEKVQNSPIRFYAEGVGVSHPMQTGFTLFADRKAAKTYGCEGQGIVRLGSPPQYTGKFIVDTGSETFTDVTMYIQGYFV